MSTPTYTPPQPATIVDPFAALTQSFTPKRAVSYLRVSTREQAERGGREEGFSIPAQRDANKKKASSIGAMVVKEFVERGVSGTSTNRPALQEMLRYLKEEAEHVDYVIVHKLDRLARNRADDVEINKQFDQLGIRLVSTSENIDQTPGGILLHGIMSSIAEFYSRNLSNEVLKGMSEKVRNGGSVGRAPIGYLNTRVIENGHEARIVTTDTKRAPLVKWAFEAYAADGWTVSTLTDELNKRGLTTVPTAKMTEGPVGVRQIHSMLSNPFYTGIVTFKGAHYPGKHEPLVDTVTFERVQSIMRSRLSGERSRKHVHYLKSTVFCGNCGSRLMVQHNRSGGNGEIYEYYSCTGRHAKRTSCNFRSIQIPRLEALIQHLYERISIDADFRTHLEGMLRATLTHLRRSENQERGELEALKLQIQRKQQKLLEAHYNDAIPIEMLRDEQKRLDQELADVTRKLDSHLAAVTSTDTIIAQALDLGQNVASTYRHSPDHIRRLFNQLFFERLKVVYDEHEATWAIEPEYTESFAFLGDTGLRVIARKLTLENGVIGQKVWMET